MRNTSTLLTFFAVMALSAAALIIIWPSSPGRYLPGDFWPQGRGIEIGGFERETMALGLDLQGGAHLTLQANPPDDFEGDVDEALDVAADIIERRVNVFGVSEAEISRASGNRIDVQIPGMTLQEAEDLVGRTASLEYFVFNDAGELVPATGTVDGQTIHMTGQYLQNNTEVLQQGISYSVAFETTGVGSELMEQITTRALQYPAGSDRNRLLIFLDEELISDAQVSGVISNEGVISGLESFSRASDLSKQLNAGALPVPLETIASNEVSATLGDDSVKDSVNAAEIGLVAVIAFMVLFYRLPGALAAGALVIYTILTLAVFKLWPVTLTLSGIAAFILSIGMAIDANILIFERTKDELRRGRTLNTAIDLGFKKAWSSIRDSNIATFIICAILYWFGEQFGASFVRGFAITLAIGVAVSMFSAITVTRTFLKMIVGTRLAKSAWLFNAKERPATARGTNDAGVPRRGWLIRFSRARWITMAVSTVLMIGSIIVLAIPPALEPGIDFTGGSTFTVEFEEPVAVEELRDTMSEIGYPEARVQASGADTFIVRTAELEGAPALTGSPGPSPPGEIDTIFEQLREQYGPAQRLDFATVSGTVSDEIARNATIAVVAASVAILFYIWFAFRSVQRPWKYGACAVIALAHDALIVLGLFSILGKVSGTEVDTAFVVAILTVIGFSVHDTIVVFDRIREEVTNDPNMPFTEVVDQSLTETLVRSVNTSFVTLLTIVAMFLIGGVTIQNFLLVMLVGIIAGAYSSIGFAAQLLLSWENGDFGRLFGRGRRDDEDVRVERAERIEDLPEPDPAS